MSIGNFSLTHILQGKIESREAETACAERVQREKRECYRGRERNRLSESIRNECERRILRSETL